MNALRNIIFILIYMLASKPVLCQFRIGLIDKAEQLILKQTDATINQSSFKNSFGLYASLGVNRKYFIDLSTLYGSINFTQNLTTTVPAFIGANIQFLELNVNVNRFINPNREKTHVYISYGLQLLFRNGGNEIYYHAIVPNSYWPNARLMPQMGVGCLLNVTKSITLDAIAGVRMLAKKRLIYDANINQIYFGLILSKQKKTTKKKGYIACPTNF